MQLVSGQCSRCVPGRGRVGRGAGAPLHPGPPARLAGEAAGALSLLFLPLWLFPRAGLLGWARKTVGCEVRLRQTRGTLGGDLCSVWEVLTLKKLFKNDFFFLRCKFDWASCILSGSPTQGHCAAPGVSVVVTQVWLLLALRRPSPGVLSVSSSAQDGPTEKVPAQICAVLAEQRLTVRHHFPC